MRPPRCAYVASTLLVALTLLCTLESAPVVDAAPVALPVDFDPSYAQGGYLRDAARHVFDAAIGSDGSVDVLTGVEIRRYTPGGVLDTSFGNAGVAVLPPFGGSPLGASVITRDSQGRVLVAGPQMLTTANFTVVRRFTSSGVLDLSFGTSGSVLAPGGPVREQRAIVTGPTDRVYVAGGASFVMAFTENGVLDMSFGTNGTVAVPTRQRPTDMTVDALGRIVVAGTVAQNMVLRRVSESGTVVGDTTIGPGVAHSVVCLADASCIVGGATLSNEAQLAKVTSTGALATDFGVDGVSQPDLDRTVADRTAGGLGSLAVQSDGMIVALSDFVQNDAALAIASIIRFDANGAIDNAFDGGRLTVIDWAVVGDTPRVRVLADGKIMGALQALRSQSAPRIGLFRLRGGSVPGPRFHPLTPFRVVDTRIGVGGSAAPLATDETRDVQIAGVGGVPAAGVSAVVLNLTVTQTAGTGYITVYPSDHPFPNTSSLNFGSDATRANLAVVNVGSSGSIKVFASTSVQLIVDIAGYFDDGTAVDGDRFHALAPNRVVDTRSGVGLPGPFGADHTRTLQLAGVANVPAGATAAVLNLTAVAPTESSYLTAWPSGEPRPIASNVNFGAGETTPNSVIVKLGPAGAIDIYNEIGSLDVLVDVVGWFGPATSAARYYPLPPRRVLDTRTLGALSGISGPESTRHDFAGFYSIPITGACAVALNVTAANATDPSFLTVWPSGSGFPFASNLNYRDGPPVANLVVTGLGGGAIDLYNDSGYVDVIVDVVGWFSCS